MRKSLWVILVAVLITVLLSASTAQAGKVSPQTQMFSQVLPQRVISTDNVGKIDQATIATQTFTTNQDGALLLNLSQTLDCGVCIFTVTVDLDGHPIFLQTTTPVENIGSGAQPHITLTAPIVADTHTIVVFYALQSNVTSNFPVALAPGTLSLLVMTPATSN